MNTELLITNPSLSINNYTSKIDHSSRINIKEVKLNDQLLFFVALFVMYLVKLSPDLDYGKNYTNEYHNTLKFAEEASLINPVLNKYINSFEVKNEISEFLEYKQLLTSKYLIENGVSSTCFLNDDQLLNLHSRIANKYKSLVLTKTALNISSKKIDFLFKNNGKNKSLIQNALDVQNKYHIPASVLLAQAMIQSDWGNRMYEKNLFSIIDGDELKSYDNYQEAFEDYAKSLSTNKKYATLFTGGKNYKNWTDKLGKIQCNENVFSLEKDCINQMEELIKIMHLDLLDY